VFRYKLVVLYCDNEEIAVIIKIIVRYLDIRQRYTFFAVSILFDKKFTASLCHFLNIGWQFSVIINRLSSLLIWYRATTYPQFVIALRWRVLNVPASLLHVNLMNNAYERSLHIAGRKLISGFSEKHNVWSLFFLRVWRYSYSRRGLFSETIEEFQGENMLLQRDSRIIALFQPLSITLHRFPHSISYVFVFYEIILRHLFNF